MSFMNEDFKEPAIVKNPLVIYHANCADGFSAAWCFHSIQEKWEQAFDFHPGVYNEPPPDCVDRIVYLVDFSYKKDVVKAICEVAHNVILIDHHKTALDDLLCLTEKDSREYTSNFAWYVDLERSGAMLAWDFLHNSYVFPDGRPNPKPGEPGYTQPPLLLNHIQDRDLWKFKLAGTREISAQMFSYDYTFENWDALMSADQTELLKMTVAGAAIERKHHKDIAEIVKVCGRLMDIGGYVVPVASIPYTMSSDAGQLMAAKYMDGKLFAACYIDTSNHRVFNLRSAPDGIDVSLIAKAYGGGGHKHAAGFRVPRDHHLAQV